MSNRRESGFSLLEVLLGGSLLAALGVLGMRLHENQQKHQKTVEANYEIVTLMSQIRNTLRDQGNCSMTLMGLSPTNGVPANVKKKVNTSYETVYSVGTIQPGNVKIILILLLMNQFCRLNFPGAKVP